MVAGEAAVAPQAAAPAAAMHMAVAVPAEPRERLNRREVIAAQQERRHASRRQRDEIDPMDPVSLPSVWPLLYCAPHSRVPQQLQACKKHPGHVGLMPLYKHPRLTDSCTAQTQSHAVFTTPVE